MIRFVLDTDTVSLLERGDAMLLQRIARHDARQLATTVITVEEQMTGRLATLRAAKTLLQQVIAYRRLADTTEALRHLAILPFTEPAIQRYEELWALKLNVGKMDLRIAAIALELGATVVTRNLRDFTRVPGLTCEDWSAATES